MSNLEREQLFYTVEELLIDITLQYNGVARHFLFD